MPLMEKLSKFFALSNLRNIMLIVAVILFIYPIFQSYELSGTKEALKTAGKQVLLPDIKIKQGMEKLINEAPESRFERIKIFWGILSGISMLYFIGFIVYKVDFFTGQFSQFKGALTAVLILAVLELIYLGWNATPDLPFRGLWLLFSHFGTFLEPIIPFAKALDRIDILDPKNH